MMWFSVHFWLTLYRKSDLNMTFYFLQLKSKTKTYSSNPVVCLTNWALMIIIVHFHACISHIYLYHSSNFYQPSLVVHRSPSLSITIADTKTHKSNQERDKNRTNIRYPVFASENAPPELLTGRSNKSRLDLLTEPHQTEWITPEC